MTPDQIPFFLAGNPKSTYKILVAGSRFWNRPDLIHRILDYFPPGTILIHGGAKGADTMAHAYGLGNDFVIRRYPALWDLHGKAAGPVRNTQMLEEEHLPESPIDLVLAFSFPDSRGTMDMVSKATSKKIPVVLLTLPKPSLDRYYHMMTNREL